MRHKITNFVLALFLTTPLWAPTVTPALLAQATQTAGSIAGTITDPSGAILTGVTVTLTSAQDGQTRNATTNAQGAYNFRGIDSGTYTISVDVPGFAHYVGENVAVRAGQPERVDNALDIAVEKQEVQSRPTQPMWILIPQTIRVQ